MKNKNAFTMLELIFVIIVIGILSSLVLPKLDRDLRQEAADNILKSIRYTQHLSLIDDKTDPFDSSWQKKLWAIRFNSSQNSFYTICSDSDNNGITEKDCLVDENGKYLYSSDGLLTSSYSKSILLGRLFGINSISSSGGCSSIGIAFDHFGRPFVASSLSDTSDYSGVLLSDCRLKFMFIDSDIDDLIIIINKESGYSYIEGQLDS